jgi:hypothetical protein
MKPRDLTDLLLLAALWGASFLFLREAITVQMAAGGAVILVGTALALGLVGAPRGVATSAAR